MCSPTLNVLHLYILANQGQERKGEVYWAWEAWKHDFMKCSTQAEAPLLTYHLDRPLQLRNMPHGDRQDYFTGQGMYMAVNGFTAAFALFANFSSSQKEIRFRHRGPDPLIWICKHRLGKSIW